MSWLEKIQNSGFGRPFRKRQKLGEDGDDWCDAFSNFVMDSSSSDEFFDAHEQVPVNSDPKGRKRKRTKSKNNKQNQKRSEIFGDTSSSSSKADTSAGIERTSEVPQAQSQEGQPASWSEVKGKTAQRKEKLQKRKSRMIQWHPTPPSASTRQGSKSIGDDGYKFDPKKKCLDSRFEFETTPKSSSSSNVDEQMDTQHAQGGLSDKNLLEVVEAIGGNIGTVNQLGIRLGFTYSQLATYNPQGIPVGYSGPMSMLQDWKHKTSQQQQLPKLLAALKNSGLYSVASKLDIKEDPIRVAKPKNRGQFEYNAPSSSSSVADHKTGVHRGMKEPPSPDAGSQVNKGGISEEQLEKLADDLHQNTSRNSYYGDICLLGQHLGFTNTNVFKYCGYQMQNDSDGILRMLKAWKKKTPIAHQRSGLIGALERANLSDLASNFHHFQKVVYHSMDFQKGNISGSTSKLPTQEAHLNTDSTAAYSGKDQRGRKAPIPQNPKVTVTLMTSSQLHTIDGLKKKLETLKRWRPQLIDKVKVLQLPYSRIQHYRFSEDVDIMILCHSIENRPFAITNVTDSLYDEFLDYCYKTLGKEKIVVVAHDFPPEAKEVRDVKMDSFKHTQWTTFEKAGLVMICGMMDKKPEMQEEDWASLVRFLEAASKPTPVKDDPRLPLPGQKDSRECNPESNKWGGSKPQTTKSVSAKISEKTSSVFRFGSPKLVSREPIIYLCTSFGLHSVRGLEENLRNLLGKCHNRFEITAQELPYNYRDLREFRFPAETGANDAMILCHSMQNKGFLITDVENSIYDQYLHHCNKVFGKEHVALIVHDFDCSEEILGIHMDAFQRTQPKTFQLAGFVALARNATNVQLSLKDSTKLKEFVMKIR